MSTRRRLISTANHPYIILEDNPKTDNTENVDFIREVKVNLGNYVAEMTETNAYPLSAGSFDEIANRNTSDSSLSALGYLDKDVPPEVRTLINTNSKQLDLDDSPFDRSKAPETLKEISENPQGSSFNRRVQRVLGDASLYNPEKPFVPKEGFQSDKEANLASVGVQTKLGEYSPKKGGSNQTVQVGDLRKMGLAVLLNASGELIQTDNPSDAGNLATTAIPGLARVGVKLPISRFSVLETYKQINPAYTKPTSTELYSGPNNVTSYGSPFNHIASLNSIASSLAVGLMAATVYGLATAVSLLTKVPSVGSNLFSSSRSTRRSLLGRSESTSTSRGFLSTVGLAVRFSTTKNDYYSCVQKGLQVFFGINDGFENAAEAFNTTHQFFGPVLRAVIRSAANLVLPGVQVAVNAVRHEAVDVNDVEQFSPFKVVENINNSMLFKFVNIMASMGDVALTNEDYYNRMDSAGVSSFWDLIEELEEENDAINPAILYSKHRLTSNGKLAWRQNSIKSMYLLPPSLLSSAQRFGNESQVVAFSGIGAPEISSISSDNVLMSDDSQLNDGKRIKAEYVKMLEEYLEQDYMPFYMHDLRTNEIISFHAFLETVTDGFTANWATDEGYGRIDQVASYKSTERSIGITFKLVALDGEDFDLMWVKINKLVTMVYPQWSEGRKLKFGGNTFTQPFSQFPSASPIIRLRLGDTIKTNYSKFNLARLFGVSMNRNQFSIENMNDDGQIESETYARIRERIRAIRQNQVEGGYEVGDVAFVASRPTRPYTLESPAMRTPDPAPRRGTRPRRGRAQPATRQGRTPTGVTVNTKSRVIVVRNAEGDLNFTGSAGLVVRLENPGAGQEGNFLVTVADLEPDHNAIAAKARAEILNDNSPTPAVGGATTTTNPMEAFLSDTQNPIFRAFASTAGTGLAGYLKSLRFDYTETMWNVDSYNGRAPKIIRVDFEFSPIHDIPPGIDSNGFNRAPLYNTGHSMGTICNSDANEYGRKFVRFNANNSKLNI